MSISKKSWGLYSCNVSTWTDFIVGTAKGETVRSVIIANYGTGAANIKIRVTDSLGNVQAFLVPSSTYAANAYDELKIDIINLIGAQKIQVFSDSASVSFYASGVSYS